MQIKFFTEVNEILDTVVRELSNLGIEYDSYSDNSKLIFDLGAGKIKIGKIGDFLEIWFEMHRCWWNRQQRADFFPNSTSITVVDYSFGEYNDLDKIIYLKKILRPEEFSTEKPLLWRINYWHKQLSDLFGSQKEK